MFLILLNIFRSFSSVFRKLIPSLSFLPTSFLFLRNFSNIFTKSLAKLFFKIICLSNILISFTDSRKFLERSRFLNSQLIFSIISLVLAGNSNAIFLKFFRRFFRLTLKFFVISLKFLFNFPEIMFYSMEKEKIFGS